MAMNADEFYSSITVGRQYVAGRQIGSGGLGVVHEVTEKGTGDKFARKRIKKDNVDLVKYTNEARMTLRTSLMSEHVVKVIAIYPQDEFYCIVMDPVAKSDLSTWIKARNGDDSTTQILDRDLPSEMRLVLGWMYCLTSTLSTLHAAHICHRDIKPANFLLSEQDNILVSDFGMSLVRQDDGLAKRTHTLVNARFSAPEADRQPVNQTNVLHEYRTDESGDVFSLGCVFLELLNALCIGLDIKFPAEYPHEPWLRFANTIRNPSFRTAMHAVKIPQEKLACLPSQEQYPGLIEDLISYIIRNMLTEQKEQRKSCIAITFGLRTLITQAGGFTPSCCLPRKDLLSPYACDISHASNQIPNWPLTFSISTTYRRDWTLDGFPDLLKGMGGSDTLDFIPTCCTLIEGTSESILVNVPETRSPLDVAETGRVIDFLKKSSRTLKYVYITRAQRCHNFALRVILAAFPNARAIATSKAIPTITADSQWELKGNDSLDRYSPIKPLSKEHAVPIELEGNTIELDRETIHVVHLEYTNGENASALWVPSLRLLVVGDAVYGGVYPSISQSSSKALRDKWRAALDRITELQPQLVVCSHWDTVKDHPPDAIEFTRQYLDALELIDAHTHMAEEFFSQIIELFPRRLNPSAVWKTAKMFKSGQWTD